MNFATMNMSTAVLNPKLAPTLNGYSPTTPTMTSSALNMGATALNLTVTSASPMGAFTKTSPTGAMAGKVAGVPVAIGTSDPWCEKHQPLFTRLVKQSVIDMCMQNLAWDGKLEIDGILSISNGCEPGKQILIKVHEALIKQSLGQMTKLPLMPLKIANGTVTTSAQSATAAGGRGGGIVGLKAAGVKSPRKSFTSPGKKHSPPKLAPKLGITLTSQGKAGLQPMPLMRSLLSKAIHQRTGNRMIKLDPSRVGPGKIIKRPLAMLSAQERQERSAAVSVSSDGDNMEGDENSGAEAENYSDSSGSRLPLCKICSTTFQGFSALQVHNQERHKRHTCKQCYSTFSLRCNLRRHERLHAGVKPHACHLCKKSFSRGADLRAHMRKHSSDKLPDWISCSKCTMAFKSPGSLRLHMFKVHKLKDSVYACDICEKVFQDSGLFDAHRASHAVSLVNTGRSLAQSGDDGCLSPALSALSTADSASASAMDSEDGTGSESGLPHTDDTLAMSEQYNAQAAAAADAMNSPVNLSIVKKEHGWESHLPGCATSALTSSISSSSTTTGTSTTTAATTTSSTTISSSSSSWQQGQTPGGGTARGEAGEEDFDFDRPLVINIQPELDLERDASASDNNNKASGSSRRKSRPVRFVPTPTNEPADRAHHPEADEDRQNHGYLATASGGIDLSLKKTSDSPRPLPLGLQKTATTASPMASCNSSSEEEGGSSSAKRIKLEEEAGIVASPAPVALGGTAAAAAAAAAAASAVSFAEGMSLESLMSRVNESLYKNYSVDNTPKRILVGSPNNRSLFTGGGKVLVPVSLASAITPTMAGTPAGMGLAGSPAGSNPTSATAKNKKKRRSDGSCQAIKLLVVNPDDADLEQKNYTCSQWGCSCALQGFNSYEEHSLSVHGRFPCKYCSQTFSGRNNRTRHVRYHLTGKQHKCDDCGKFFTRPDSLKEHRFIHTRSYQESVCRNCQTVFDKKATLLSHLKKCFTDEQLEVDKNVEATAPMGGQGEGGPGEGPGQVGIDDSLRTEVGIDDSLRTEVGIDDSLRTEVGMDGSLRTEVGIDDSLRVAKSEPGTPLPMVDEEGEDSGDAELPMAPPGGEKQQPDIVGFLPVQEGDMAKAIHCGVIQLTNEPVPV